MRISHKIDVVLADTAGRFHNKANLMNQLDKIKRVMKPDLVVYVDEAVAGNDAVIRAFEFDKTVGADAMVLTKADMDSRGGAAISIAHTIGKPLMFLGTGQSYDDIAPFEPAKVVEELLGDVLMLDGLSSSLKDALKKLAGKTVIDRAAVDELVKDLQRALISSDVNVKLVMESVQGRPHPFP